MRKKPSRSEPYPSFVERAEEFRIKSPSYCRGIFLQIHSAGASLIPPLYIPENDQSQENRTRSGKA